MTFGHHRIRTRTPLRALEPHQDTDTRQQSRRKVIVVGKKFRYFWAKTGAPKRIGGPTPARLVRPKRHRWLVVR